jgi:glycosyltransferase involved in cell wall biosynthesis
MRRGTVGVLHVVHALDPGGIETWLLHVLRHAARDRFRMDFLVSRDPPGAYDGALRALGANVIRCPDPIRFWSFGRRFKRALGQFGPYAVVHSHFNPCGYPLLWAHQAGVRVRIAHSHNACPELGDLPRPVRALFLPLAGHWVARHSTHGLAAGREAARALFGPAWERDPRRRVLYCGVDLTPFRAPVNPGEVRKELGLPPDAFVVGHVGRFQPQKNHTALIDIAAELARREPRFRLLLVGDGPLRPAIARKVAEAGLTSRVHFAGLRSDVARLMLGAFDAFVLPSLHEGLPLVGIEAQAAGLPCLVSAAVTEELDVVRPLVRRLSLTSPPACWAEALLDLCNSRPAHHRAEALRAVEESPFNIRSAVKQLEALYEEGLSSSAP